MSQGLWKESFDVGDTLFGTQTALYATLTIIGRDSGARVQIPITINQSATTSAFTTGG